PVPSALHASHTPPHPRSHPARRSSDLQTMSETITDHLLEQHTATFTSGKEPGHVQVMLEEAHNLFASDRYKSDADVWVRLAKEADRKSTRLNSSHVKISYAVFCLKKKE